MEKSKKLKISVAMTTHNSREYLEEQLDSLRLQEKPADEVIIVDDASSNDTTSRIRTYIDEYHLSSWRLFINDVNRGYISSFQRALSLCSGDLIFLCDHDDIWHPDKVRRMVYEMKNHPKELALLCSFDEIDGQGKPLKRKTSMFKANNGLIRHRVTPQAISQLPLQDVLIYNVGPGCCAALRKELALQYLNQSQDLELPHDWGIFALAAIQGGLFYMDLPLVSYRLHGSNTLGFTRASSQESRKQRIHTDLKQKKALSELLLPLAGPMDQKKITRAEEIFTRRKEAYDRKQPGKLIRLLLPSLSYRGLYQTIGFDLVTLLKSKDKEMAS